MANTKGSSLKKIVYFDEGSATDFLILHYGGVMITQENNEKTSGSKFSFQSSVEGGAGQNFFEVLKAKVSILASAEASRLNESVINKTFSNATLSDFHAVVEDSSESGFQSFNNIRLTLPDNSFTLFKMLVPYMGFMSQQERESMGFDGSQISEVLMNVKGYYEFLTKKDGKDVVLRFNTVSFQNAYTLNDLLSLRLTCYGVKSGSISKKMLNVTSEIERMLRSNIEAKHTEDDDIIEELKYDSEKSALEDKEIEVEQELEMYDIVLAGIEVTESG